MYENQLASLRPVAWAILTGLAAIAMASPAFAGEDDTPLSLTLAHDINRDSNFTKDDNNKVGDTINTTSAQVSLNKDYGRQNYQAGLKLSKQQHAHFNELNYDGKDANAAFTTEFLRNWSFSANGAYSDTLNPVQNNVQTDRIDKNIRKYRDSGFSVQYGNGGTWAVAGSYDTNKQTYSALAQQYQNADQRTTGLRAIYYSTDLLNYSVGARHAVTNYPGYPDNPPYGQVVNKYIDFSVDYRAAGVSGFNATVSRVTTSYVPAELAASRGWTGSAVWTYTPHGIFSYTTNFSRTTGTDRQRGTIAQADVTYVGPVNDNTVTTNLALSARAQLTGKLGVSASYSVSHFKTDQTADFDGVLYTQANSGIPLASYNHTTGISFDYNPLRSLSFVCSFQRYSQGQDLYRLKYSGNAVDCSANFTLH